ncbi:GNAT family N-acetyltransferase [Paenibacillus lautus]|uniref:GNAT family N-acetyltransferase n=1 Tax=Paenibacillus lautus TaxID=1401 RepID=UPI003D2CFDE6
MIVRTCNHNDYKAIYELWIMNLGQQWPIEYVIFDKIIRDNDSGTSHFVAEINGNVVGFIATGTSYGLQTDLHGSILLVVVEKQNQGKGIGKQLVTHAEQYLFSKGVRDIHVGSGARPYFWPGVPANLPDAIVFFEKCGWIFTEQSFDMIQDLKMFPSFKHVPLQHDTIIEVANTQDIEKLLVFQQENFPHWYIYYNHYSNQKNFDNILLAKTKVGEIIGSVLLTGPFDLYANQFLKWKNLLPPQVGGFVALGVKEEMRGKGIGLFLAFKATEVIKSRGVESSYLGWTWLIDWYSKIGYQVWRCYRMSRKVID